MNATQWMIYGANGYTGRRIAEQAAARGLRPVLAGRDAARIRPLADRLGCTHRQFALDDPARVAAGLEGMGLVLNCAGPFSRTAEPMIEACLRAAVHYLDITGEIEVIEAAAARNARAAAAGVVLIPAVGFDVVPSDCLAALLAQRLPAANLLQLAFSGTGRLSPGTARTVLEALPQGGRVRRDGRIVAVPLACKTIRVELADGPRTGVSVPWGDVASAWHTTGIPNIEVYLMMPEGQARWMRRLGRLAPLLRLPLPIDWIRAGLSHFMAGPEADQAGGTLLWGRVSNAEGRQAEATLTTPEAYRLTVLSALAAVERVLAGGVGRGFLTPAKAFGVEFVLSLPEVRLATTSPSCAGS
jgi:short subunit dehydrogenase-like uncharacterized protein